MHVVQDEKRRRVRRKDGEVLEATDGRPKLGKCSDYFATHPSICPTRACWRLRGQAGPLFWRCYLKTIRKEMREVGIKHWHDGSQIVVEEDFANGCPVMRAGRIAKQHCGPECPHGIPHFSA